MKTYRGKGARLDWTNSTGTTQLSGSLQVIEDRVGVLVNDTANAAAGVLEVCNCEHELSAVTAESWAQGVDLYRDSVTGKLTQTASGNVPAGYASAAKLALATTAKIILNG